MADQISEKDVESLGEKLEQFSQTLTTGEQAALMEILERANTEEGDVQGFANEAPAMRRGHYSVKAFVRSAIRFRR